jgi:hypothetical protein
VTSEATSSHSVIRSLPYYKGVTKELRSPLQNNELTYTEGTTVTADGIDLDPKKDCGQGINFCRSVAEALSWGPTVVEITVPRGVKVVDTGGKLRAAKVKVGPVVNLYGAYLARAYLSGANLSRANLSGADLSRANLSGADLTEANLTGAYLARAYLSGADLSGANLSGAYLSGADLSGADLSGANLSGADLSGSKADKTTTLPAGYELSKAGLIVRAK